MMILPPTLLLFYFFFSNKHYPLSPLHPSSNKGCFGVYFHSLTRLLHKDILVQVDGVKGVWEVFGGCFRQVVEYGCRILSGWCNRRWVANPSSTPVNIDRSYIKNGGDPFSLQRILGHTNQETTSKYVNMARTNVKSQHSKYSPGERLGQFIPFIKEVRIING